MLAQVARNLTDCADGFLQGKRFLILDRDRKFTAEFKQILEDAGVRPVLTSYQAPNMNAFAERSIRGDAVSKIGDVKVCQRLGELVNYYHRPAA